MKKINICKFCILDETISDVKIDNNGKCNFCRKYEKYKKEKKINLNKLFEEIKHKNKYKKYDVIIGVSGGIDSSYCLYLAVKKYKLRVLALHVDSGWNSNDATINIYNLVKALNVDLYTEVIEWDEMKDLNSFLKASVINCDIPQDHCFKAIQYKIANKYKIYDFISGRNEKIDGMMPYSLVGHSNEDGRHLKYVHDKFGKVKLIKFPIFNIYYSKIYMKYIKGYNDIKILENVDYKEQL